MIKYWARTLISYVLMCGLSTPHQTRTISVGKDFYQSYLTDMTPRTFRDIG